MNYFSTTLLTTKKAINQRINNVINHINRLSTYICLFLFLEERNI